MSTIKELVDETVELEYELQTYFEDEPQRPTPGQPATDDQLNRLAQWLTAQRLPFPPSYREFLATTNGVAGFMAGFSLRDADSVMLPPLDPHRRNYPELSRFIVSESESLEFLAFDVGDPSDEEPGMVFVADTGEDSRYDSFTAFLTEHLAALDSEAKDERADRAKLKKKKK